jgi:hypothetical protein
MLLFGVFLFVILQVNGFTSKGVERKTPHSKTQQQLVPDKSSTPKQRIITPNDIASLFGSTTSKQTIVEDDELEFDDETDEDSMESKSLQDLKPLLKSKVHVPPENAVVIAELEKIQAMSMSDYNRKAAPIKKTLAPPVAPEMEYLDLSADLSADLTANVKNALTLIDEDEISSNMDAPRVFSYDPAESARMYDPMKFGAYARWKKAEEAVEAKKAKKNPKKTKEGLSPDSFYNAIKNLGSGPKSKDTPTGVGVAEPPAGMSPVTPKKGL